MKCSAFKKLTTIFLELNINIFIITDERRSTPAIVPIYNTERQLFAKRYYKLLLNSEAKTAALHGHRNCK
jgi:hypothetical protein